MIAHLVLRTSQTKATAEMSLGIREELQSKKNARIRLNVFNAPDRDCYLKFFVGRRPPVGFDAVNANFIRYRYICQPNDQQTFYAMLFDQQRGLAVFAAYSLEHGEVDFAPQRSKGWSITKGGNLFTVRNSTLTL